MRVLAIVISGCLLFSAELSAQASSKDKIKTIRSLAKQGYTAIDPLRGYLKDAAPEVRREAVLGIAGIGGPRSLEPLTVATADADAGVEAIAVEGLANFYYPGYMPKGMTASVRRLGRGIKDRFVDSSEMMIDPGIQVRRDVQDAIASVVRQGTSFEARAAAARAAGVLRAQPAAAPLAEALRSKDTRLIYESLVALQKIRDPETAAAVEFLLQDLNERVQIAALETVGMLRNQSASPGIREALSRARSGKVRSTALASLAMLGDPANRATFDQYLDDPDESMRAAAAEGIGRLGDRKDLDQIERAFAAETKMKPRLSLAFAACALGRTMIGEFSPLEYLVNTLNSTTYHNVAAAFLRELSHNRDVRENLYPGIEQRTRAEKVEIAGVLSHTGDRAAIPVLETLSRDPDPEVGKAATRSLRAVGARNR
jgi:HEAT repeat protein